MPKALFGSNQDSALDYFIWGAMMLYYNNTKRAAEGRKAQGAWDLRAREAHIRERNFRKKLPKFGENSVPGESRANFVQNFGENLLLQHEIYAK